MQLNEFLYCWQELDALEEGFVINYDPNDQTLYDRSFDSKGASNEKRKRGRRGDDLDEDGKVNDPNESEEFSEDEYSENDYIDDETAPQDAIYQPATNQKGWKPLANAIGFTQRILTYIVLFFLNEF